MLFLLCWGLLSSVTFSNGEIITFGSKDQTDCENCFNVDFDNSIWLKQDKGNLYWEKEESSFGISLALDNDTVYLGAPGYKGYGTLFQCPIDFDKSESTTTCYDTKVNEKIVRSGKQIQSNFAGLVLTKFHKSYSIPILF